MANYSHSKLSTFEQCKYKYKLQYIDKVQVDIPTSVEAFMGSMVHEALEKLYNEILLSNKIMTKQEVLKYYFETWQKNWDDNILIVRTEYKPDNYKNKGAMFLFDYYDKYQPFDQDEILGLETSDYLILKEDTKYSVKIDRLTRDKDGNYYVRDYKTNGQQKTQDQADADRQLAMYSLWVKQTFKDYKSVKLVWHMLAFNEEVQSERTDFQLEHLKQDILRKISIIEKTNEFPINKTALCKWCVFQEICPAFDKTQKTLFEY